MRVLLMLAAAGAGLLLFAGAAPARLADGCVAQTEPATNVTSTGATLRGQISDPEVCYDAIFDYGTTISYPSFVSGTTGAGLPAPVDATVTGLTPDTTYHYRIDTSEGAVGGDVTFHTSPAAPPPAILVVTNTANPTTDSDRANITYRIVVTGHGSGDSNNVGMDDVLPAGLALVSVTTTVGSCSGTTTVSCSIGTLASGASATVTLVAAPFATGSITNTATVHSGNLDPGSTTSAAATVSVTAPSPTTTTTMTTTPTTTTGGSTTPTPPGFVPGKSIGGISIGMTQNQVITLLGSPLGTLTISLGGGKTGRLVRYRLHGALFFVVYDSNGHVVSIETSSPFFRTAGGVGPGSPFSLLAGLGWLHPDYCQFGYWTGTSHTGPSGVVTVFVPAGGTVGSVLITELRLYDACPPTSPILPPKPTLAFNHSIGGVSIGMSVHQIVKLLGKPKATLHVTLGGGQTGRSVRYRVHGALFLITYDSSGRVVSLETYSPFFRTADGIGPGSPMALVRALRGFHVDYCELGYWNGTARTPPDHVITVFTPAGGLVASVLITQLRLYTACNASPPERRPSA